MNNWNCIRRTVFEEREVQEFLTVSEWSPYAWEDPVVDRKDTMAKLNKNKIDLEKGYHASKCPVSVTIAVSSPSFSISYLKCNPNQVKLDTSD